MVTGSLKQHKIEKEQLKTQENRTFNGNNIRFCDYFQDSASRTGRQRDEVPAAIMIAFIEII